MRILFVNKLYPPDVGGGAEVVLAALAAGCQLRGHEVMVATTTSAESPSEAHEQGVRVIRLPLRNVYWHQGEPRRGPLARLVWHARDVHNGAMGEALSTIIQQHDPDLICSHNLAGFSASAWCAAAAAGKPQVQVLHDYYHLCPRSQMFRAGASCARPCLSCRSFRVGRATLSTTITAVIGVSQAILDAHVQQGLFTDVNIRRVIHNARPSLARGMRTDERTRVFGFIGTLGEWKGIRQLLEAFQLVSSDPSLSHLRLTVAGTGEAAYVAELQQRYASERITFMGKMAPEAFYRGIDALVVPSLWHEPLPTVVAEALSCGLPVIGSRRGGIPEMVRDGEDGLLYDPDQPHALATCLRRMAQAPTLMRAGSEVRARYFADMDRMVDEHLAVYHQAVGAWA